MSEKLIFNCTYGKEEPERATLPFVAANIPPVSIPRPPILQFTPPGSGFITSSSTSGGNFDQ